MNPDEVIKLLKSASDPSAIEGMALFGITPGKTYGVSMPRLRKLGKQAGRDHDLALKLWAHGFRETRILASLVDEPEKVSSAQMDSWASEFSYWEICDQCCMNLFWLTPKAYEKAVEWSRRPQEYVRRAGFALMAVLAWKDKKASDEKLSAFLPLIIEGSSDERPIVRKAVNWALRQIGKRSIGLNKKSVNVARKLMDSESGSARWVGSDALRELEGDAVRARLLKKGHD